MKEKIQACFLGVAIGDALGMPVETMTRAQILARHPKGIITFLPPIQDKIPEMRELPAGSTTDDWQLTRLVAGSLIARGEFDLVDIARRHVEILPERVGWGGTTTKGIEGLVTGRSIDEPPPKEPKRGAGNGIAMKVSPLACFAAAQKKQAEPSVLCSWVQRLAGLTHTHAQAWEAAYALALLIEQVLHNSYNTQGDAQQYLDLVCEKLGKVAEERGFDSVLGRLKRGRDYLNDRNWIYTEITPGWLAKESVVYAILMALSHGRIFGMGVSRAATDGIDADSTAAMVGAIMGANGGFEPIPPLWRSGGPGILEAPSIGALLYESAQFG